ncbi:LptF/LptG family permease, partial [bacterium]|nr:LptF/LptG family permease [bacterium]
YIIKHLLISFFFTLTIFTFMLFTGSLFKIIQMFLGKISIFFVVRFFMYSIPYLLSYAIPMAFLTGVLLLFGQLSAENEITALKASGVSVYRIITAPIIMGIALTVLCVFINDVVLPSCHYQLRQLKNEIGKKSPMALIEPGVIINQFDNYLIYVDEINDNQLKNISIQQEIPNKSPRFIKAETGTIELDSKRNLLILKLRDVMIEQQSENDNSGTPDFIHAKMGMVPIELQLDPEYKNKRHRSYKRMKDYKIRELYAQKKELQERLKIAGQYGKDMLRIKISKILTEINTRISLAASCLSLLFIGVALGIKTHRSEKTIGIPISLALFAVNYGFTLFGKALNKHPDFFPYLIVWIPNIILCVLGLFLIKKLSGR